MMKKTLCFILSLLFLAGCSVVPDSVKPRVASMPALEKKWHVSRLTSTPPPRLKFEMPEKDPMEGYKNDTVLNLSAVDTPLSLVLKTVEDQLPQKIIPEDIGDLRLTMNYHGPADEFFCRLREIANVEPIWNPDKNTILVRKHCIRTVEIPTLLTNQRGSMSQEGISVDVSPKDLEEVLKDAADNFGVDIRALSTATGLMTVYGRPRQVDDFLDFVKKEINERMQYVIVRVRFIQLNLDRAKGYNFDFSALADLSGSLAGRISLLPSNPVGEAGKSTMAFSMSSSKFSSLLNFMNNFGQTEIIASPSILTANGLPAVFAITKESGYWQPGELDVTQNSDQTLMTEERPEWKSITTGLIVTVRPKFIRSKGRKYVELDVEVSNSDIYGVSTTSWDRGSGHVTTLERPLESRKEVLSRAVIDPDHMILLAGLDAIEKTTQLEALPGVEIVHDKNEKAKQSRLFLAIDAVYSEED